MWAHYGDNGYGACLVFSIPKPQFAHVQYVRKRIACEENFEFPEPQLDGNFFNFCSKKFSAWKYESEARHFCQLEGNSDVVDIMIDEVDYKFRKFCSDFKLVGVINGPKPTISQAKFLFASDEPIEFFQCRAAFTGFHLTSQRQTNLWT
tara:strand:+ start:395 stop:841 length:447 start_codon:yes stop_codon:yes gene_type:complete